MAIGMYDTPIQGQFVNTYVPIPFEEILKAGQMRQSAQDEFLANLANQESAINTMPYAPYDEPVVKQAALNADRIAREAARLDLSQGINRRSIQEKLRNSINLQQLSTVARNKEAFDKRAQAEYDLRMRNMYNEDYEKQNDPLLSGKYAPGTPYNYMPQAMTDPDTIIESMLKDVRPDSYSNVDKETGHITNVEHISPSKLRGVVKQNIDALMTNPSMRWAVDYYRRTSNDYTTPAADIILQRAEKAIPRFAFTSEKDAGWAPTGGGGKEGSSNPFINSRPNIDVPLPPVDLPKTETNWRAFRKEKESLMEEKKRLEATLKMSGIKKENKDIIESSLKDINRQLDAKQRVEDSLGMPDVEKEGMGEIYKRYNTIPEEEIDNFKSFAQERFNAMGSDMSILNSIEFKDMVKKHGIVKSSRLLDDIKDLSVESKQEPPLKKYFNRAKDQELLGISENEAVMLPPQYKVSSGVGMIQDFTKPENYVESLSYKLLQELKTNVDTKRVVSIDGQDNKHLSVFKEAPPENIEVGGFSIVPDMVDNKPGWYQYVTVTSPKGKGKGVKRYQYKVYYDTKKQQLGIASDYAVNGKLLEAYIWTRPEIADAFVSQKGDREIKVSKFNYDEKGNVSISPIPINIKRLPNGKYMVYDVNGKQTREEPYDKQEAIYKIYNDEFNEMFKNIGKEGVTNYFNNSFNND